LTDDDLPDDVEVPQLILEDEEVVVDDYILQKDKKLPGVILIHVF
jgi:hypothetical protein